LAAHAVLVIALGYGCGGSGNEQRDGSPEAGSDAGADTGHGGSSSGSPYSGYSLFGNGSGGSNGSGVEAGIVGTDGAPNDGGTTDSRNDASPLDGGSEAASDAAWLQDVSDPVTDGALADGDAGAPLTHDMDSATDALQADAAGDQWIYGSSTEAGGDAQNE
jgi:hypothetical protein